MADSPNEVALIKAWYFSDPKHTGCMEIWNWQCRHFQIQEDRYYNQEITAGYKTIIITLYKISYMKQRLVIAAMATSLMVYLLTSCYKNKEDIPGTAKVSFQGEIMPIMMAGPPWLPQ